ncbi:TIGR04283 family arsenosugar biosynthesis glycosyltransferase [Muricauda sp. 2012CJ35-5]|uniref:TIGR04283 family arsenosugar biosynthesis glycosyltransferase n=1 Tax=Flagellimonas spongiicola TaxID=2942208 RepID=A0ABT0PRL9_9FLAO|nr:TIGR04283 family arsenosugar biosynthesis glycosyltransferase [Allomuricauda spongiicola]MCL6273861.1 TIGR04283 family arsenosugar biosynthesis glycosyltransferase [Allomuricauda spongiicola]
MSPNNSISIIIPVLNEERLIGKVIDHLHKTSTTLAIKEILCVDGGSSDNTCEIVKTRGATVIESGKGRAKQMNKGARNATGKILYFLHADTFTPQKFDEQILEAIGQGYDSGCFRMKFDTRNPILRFFAYLSRINHRLCRGGDQSLFVKRDLFNKTEGFNEAYLIYEDTEFITRLYKKSKFKIIPDAVITSARKYREKGWLRVQYHFGMIHLKNYMGAEPEELYSYYKKNILA